ncbi:MAG: cytochrome c biogenesis protein ResB [Bdellovibrio sp.]|nr:cytochrome c biogenesis protein ResB [Bdellovibrio sp.]
MEKIKSFLDKLVRTIGGMKFAVVIITLFVIAMIAGTFIESYYGTDFAGRVLYQSVPFMILQGLLVTSILFATLLRLPPKERLYGFYIIHIGLIVIFIGALITAVTGIDGHLTLAPNDPTRRVILADDILIIKNETTRKEAEIKLPNTYRPSFLNIKWREVEVLDYLPFSKNIMEWADAGRKGLFNSSSYQMFNDTVSQTLTFSRHPDGETTNHQELGPLSVEYLPEQLAECFAGLNRHDIFFWDLNITTCFNPSDKRVQIRESKKGHRMAFVTYNDQPFVFLPDKSPFPVDKELKPIRSSDLRALSSKLFQTSPIIFLFGKQLTFFSKLSKQWEVHTFQHMGDEISLPWMGFKIKLLNHSTDQFPTLTPIASLPEKKGGEVISGEQRAIKVRIAGIVIWVRGGQEERVKINDNFYSISLSKKSLELPFELTLQQFKMDTNPGTKTPASYESFVNLFDGQSNSSHHIYMNNPLKYNRLTFYQSSYFQENNGQYGSILSVNFDPGRPIKYLGSLLLVIGCIIHYLIGLRRKSV